MDEKTTILDGGRYYPIKETCATCGWYDVLSFENGKTREEGLLENDWGIDGDAQAICPDCCIR